MKFLNDNQQESFFLSIVMPVYNEEDVIEKVVCNFCDKVLNRFKKKEFILVNDCSADATLSILKRLQREYPYIRIFTNSRNRGYGISLLRAYRAAKGDYIFHSDSDNQFIAEDFWPIWEKLRKGNLDLVMGYRKKRKDPLHRILISNILRLFNFVLLGVLFHDINAPFKLYVKPSLMRVLSNVSQDTSIPTILMVLSAHTYNMHIDEVPVRHFPRLTGKSFYKSWKIIVFCWEAGKEIIQFKKRLRKSS